MEKAALDQAKYRIVKSEMNVKKHARRKINDGASSDMDKSSRLSSKGEQRQPALSVIGTKKK